MTGGSLVWLGATMGVFLSASAALRAYVGGTGWGARCCSIRWAT